jgi:hypothetical protein
LKSLGRILLTFACAGVLQTALAAADIQQSRACIAAVASSSDDISDCSRSDSGNRSVRPLSDGFGLEDSPPRLKDVGAGTLSLARPIATTASLQPARPWPFLADAPVYLSTLRLRI